MSKGPLVLDVTTLVERGNAARADAALIERPPLCPDGAKRILNGEDGYQLLRRLPPPVEHEAYVRNPWGVYRVLLSQQEGGKP